MEYRRGRIAEAYRDSDGFIEHLEVRRAKPVIPARANRKSPRECDFALYCERNLVERFFNIIKHFRAIATRVVDRQGWLCTVSRSETLLDQQTTVPGERPAIGAGLYRVWTRTAERSYSSARR
jgi:transposase